MKRLKMAVVIALTAFASVFAVSNYTPEKSAGVFHQNEKKKIKKEDLPDAVKKVIENETYKYWEIDQIFFVREGGYYKIELILDDRTQTLNLDQNGNKVSVIE